MESSPLFFQELFKSSSVVSAEHLVLPSDTTVSCYESMFQDCTSLTTAPELLAINVNSASYVNLFNGCSSLTYIKCLAESATDSSYSDGFVDWVDGVASSGTFVKSSNNTEWETDSSSGIPEGWTVEAV